MTARTSRPQRNRRLETTIVLFVLALVAVVTIVVISAWRASSTKKPAPPAKLHKAPVARHTAPPPTLSIRAASGSSLVVIHRGGPSGKVAFQGTIARGQPVVLTGKSFWLQVSTPESLLIKIRGRLITVPSGAPRVITVTPTGWNSH